MEDIVVLFSFRIFVPKGHGWKVTSGHDGSESSNFSQSTACTVTSARGALVRRKERQRRDSWLRLAVVRRRLRHVERSCTSKRMKLTPEPSCQQRAAPTYRPAWALDRERD